MLNALELTGRVRTHVVQRDDLRAALHPDTFAAFLEMKADAAREGFDIGIVSGFRDFASQQRIWDMKFRGERPLYDDSGMARDYASLDEAAVIDAILCWSALPGASRHHWGSEADLVDRAAMPEGYRLRLLPSECEPGGVFHALHAWLNGNLSRYGFFRPYDTFRDGVHREPWHVSFAPVSIPALEAFTPDVLREAVEASDILGKAPVLERLDAIYTRYVANVDAPAPDAAPKAA